MRQRSYPFLHWVGGKRRLIPVLQEHYPSALLRGEIKTYIEPFVGAGAVLFSLLSNHSFKSVHICDANPNLILAYRCLQADYAGVVTRLYEHSFHYGRINKSHEDERKSYYLSVRKQFNSGKHGFNVNVLNDAAYTRVAQLIFLNKTCYNGFFRLNQKGDFNTTFGSHENPLILDEYGLRSCSIALSDIDIHYCDFRNIEKWVTSNSFIYMDPPYRPISESSSFTSYTGFDFTEEQQIHLGQLFTKLSNQSDVYLMASNSDPSNTVVGDTFFEVNYPGSHIYQTYVYRGLSGDASKRSEVRELIITNYSKPPSRVLTLF